MEFIVTANVKAKGAANETAAVITQRGRIKDGESPRVIIEKVLADRGLGEQIVGASWVRVKATEVADLVKNVVEKFVEVTEDESALFEVEDSLDEAAIVTSDKRFEINPLTEEN